MIPATQEQIEAACMTRSSEDARSYLASKGYKATHKECEASVSALIATGARDVIRKVPSPFYAPTEITDVDAMMGCRAMLRRHLETGRHWISDPARMAAAVREAGMVQA